MSLNIKNPKTHELAERVARLTGETLTEAVTIALRERLERIENLSAIEEERFRELKALVSGSRRALDRAEPLRRARRPALRRVRAAEMIVDSSALIAVLNEEPEGERFLGELTRTVPTRRISAANYLEAAIVVDANRNPLLSRRLDDLIARPGSSSNPSPASRPRSPAPPIVISARAPGILRA